MRQAREWGYQRLAAAKAVVIIDAAPPPVARVIDGGCASTLAFEMSDGPHRLTVHCGAPLAPAAHLPRALAEGPPTPAAHSTTQLPHSQPPPLMPELPPVKGLPHVPRPRTAKHPARRSRGRNHQTH